MSNSNAPIEPSGHSHRDPDLATAAAVDPDSETDDVLAGLPVPLDVGFEIPTEDAIEQQQVVPDEEDAWGHR